MTLQLLGNPTYVHFMVNPELKNIAIVPCDESDDALKIPTDPNADCDSYSKVLITLLAKLKPNVDFSKTYRLYGDAHENDQILIFNINDMVPVDSIQQPEGGDMNG